MHLPADSGNTEKIYSIFQKPENNCIDYQHKKSESQQYERKTEKFENRTNKYIQKSENNTPSDIELPTSTRKNPCLCDRIIGEKILNTKENDCIGENGYEDFHNVIGIRE